MNQTITLNPTTAKQLAKQLNQLDELKMLLLKTLPESTLHRGSKLWWEKVELMADEDIRYGRTTTHENLKQLVHDLNS